MKSSEKARKTIFFNDRSFHVSENVYEPAEDTFLLAENLPINKDDVVLDMGTGCGILGILAAEKAKKVVAVDLNPHAVRCARMNAKLHGVIRKMDIRQGDLFQSLKKNEKFDLIIFNAPYLPSEAWEHRTWLGRAWVGGPTGRQLIDRFISEAPRCLEKGGRILLVQSTLSNVEETMRKLEEKGLEVAVVAERKVAFETIVLIQAKRR